MRIKARGSFVCSVQLLLSMLCCNSTRKMNACKVHNVAYQNLNSQSSLTTNESLDSQPLSSFEFFCLLCLSSFFWHSKLRARRVPSCSSPDLPQHPTSPKRCCWVISRFCCLYWCKQLPGVCILGNLQQSELENFVNLYHIIDQMSHEIQLVSEPNLSLDVKLEEIYKIKAPMAQSY